MADETVETPCQWIDQTLLIPCGFPAGYVTQVQGVELAVCETHARIALHSGARSAWKISHE